MDRTREAGGLLIDSLVLLGISPQQVSREYGCEVCKEMFVQPNQKGLNTLLHLLFDRIKGREHFKKEIKGAWPVKDSVYQRDFNKIMHRLVLELSQQGVIPKHLAASLLQGFRQLSGSRLTALLCYLAAYALSKDPFCTSKEAEFTFKELPSSTPALEPLYRAVRAQNALERLTTVQALNSMATSQSSWTSAAEKLGQEYRLTWQGLCDLNGKEASVFLSTDSASGKVINSAQSVNQKCQQANILEAAGKARGLWMMVQTGAEKQQGLKKTLHHVITQATHPYEINGGRLQGSASNEAPSQNTVVELSSLLQDWRKLLEAYQNALPEQAEVERLQAQNRPLTPLFAGEQQKQVLNISSQHTSRLHSQKQLSSSLHDLLSVAVAQKETLQAQAKEAFGLAQPGLCAPESPTKDLIPASYPQGAEAPQANATCSKSFLPEFFTHTAGLGGSKAGGFAGSKQTGQPLSAVEVRSGLATAAYPTSFKGSLQQLKPYTANTGASILTPSGSVPDFATSFLPRTVHARDVIDALKSSSRMQVQAQWESTLANHVSASPKPEAAGLQEPGSVPHAPAPPRRLSFSSATPELEKGEVEAPSTAGNMIASGGTQRIDCTQADPPSLAEVMARLNRLHAT